MKKLSVILCAAAVIAVLCACGANEKRPESASAAAESEAESSTVSAESLAESLVPEESEMEIIETESVVSSGESVSDTVVEKEDSSAKVEESSVPAEEDSSEVPDDAESTGPAAEGTGPAAENDGILTEEEVDTFGITAYAEAAEGFNYFDDFAETIGKDLTGTWYDPDRNTAIRLLPDGTSYLYYPDLDFYGDVPYKWEYIDRSERGLCPELIIDIFGYEGTGLAYYIAGVRDNYFWCCSQMVVFYKQ